MEADQGAWDQSLIRSRSSGDGWSPDSKTSIHSSMELEDLSRKQMELLQLRGYLTVYLRNLRFREMLEAIRINRRRIVFILTKLIRPTRKTASASWLDGTGRQPIPAG